MLPVNIGIWPYYLGVEAYVQRSRTSEASEQGEVPAEDRGTYTDLLACLVYISVKAEALVGAEGGGESRSVGGRDEGEDGGDGEEQPVQQR